ncbi:hypothetical protein pb186bvf_000781 [Paramecium bursaria]
MSLKELHEKNEILKGMVQILQQKLQETQKLLEDKTQQSKIREQELLSQIEILIRQNEYLEKKSKQQRSIKNIYLTREQQPAKIQNDLNELQELMFHDLQSQIQDLKFKLHKSDMILKKPKVDVDVTRISDCITQCKTSDMDTLLSRIEEADTAWNEVFLDLLSQSRQLDDFIFVKQ